MVDFFSFTSLVFFTIGLLSMLSHAVKKWVKGEIRGNLIDWYICHPHMVAGAFITMLGGIASAILMGTLNDYTVGAQILAAWGIGYAADTINHQKP